MQPNRFLVFPILLVLLAGCASAPSPEERAALERPARTLEARGQWQAAATAWQQAAQTQEGDIALELRLNAADALLQAGDGLGAAQVARALPKSIPSQLNERRALILADASVQTGDPMDALQRLGPDLKATDGGTVARYRRIRADALEMSGDVMGAVRERSLRDPFLGSAEERYRNRQRIWDLLGQLPTAQLEMPLAPPGAAHDGWVELAALSRRNALDANQLDADIQEWSNRYPGHPAGEQIVPEIVELARVAAQPPDKVALLLPQTGPFASVAAAIREGFMTAWYADAPNEHRPQIMLFDTHMQDAAQAYNSAVNDGAQFVIGPLDKKSVSAVTDDADLSVITLALNYPLPKPAVDATPSHDGQGDTTALSTAPDTAPDTVSPPDPAITAAPMAQEQAANPAPGSGTDVGTESLNHERDLQWMYYFALSPEDEARDAAQYAYTHGARQAAILSATGTWGERVGDAFEQRWQELGGVLATRTVFPEEAQGLSAAVEQLLNIDRSKARAKRLRSVLMRNIKHEPQPRSDIDVLFMAAFPQMARQLKPLLLFHRAADVPVLATSHIYAGSVNPQADQDLNGVLFADVPWLITPDAHSLPAQARRLWPRSEGATGRLYAFGADAYALIARLRELRVSENNSYPGLTGNLSLDAQQRVRRSMQWSRFVEGQVQPVDASAQLSPSTISAQ